MDFNKLINGMTNSGLMTGVAGGMAGGALSSALMSKKGRKYGKTALKIGGLAALGGVAWKAYQSYQANQTTVKDGENSTSWRDIEDRQFDINQADPAAEAKGLLMIRAMIAAANADGHIDSSEKDRIFERVERIGLSPSEKSFLFNELLTPPTAEAIASEVTDHATAIEVYAASLIAIDQSREESAAYLNHIATLLDLPPSMVQEIKTQISAERLAA